MAYTTARHCTRVIRNRSVAPIESDSLCSVYTVVRQTQLYGQTDLVGQSGQVGAIVPVYVGPKRYAHRTTVPGHFVLNICQL